MWGTIATSQLFSVHSLFNVSFITLPFKIVHNYQGMWLERVTFASFGVFQVRKNYFVKEFSRFLCVWSMIFCERYRKKRWKRNSWADFVRFSLQKLAGLAKTLQCNWQQKWLLFGDYHSRLLWGCSLHLWNWTSIFLY